MKILILGYSSIAKRRIIPALETLPQIKTIEISSESRLSQIPELTKVNKTYDSYKKAIEKSKANIVYISTVNSLHEQLARMVLLSGRHVIVDKPAFLNLASTEKIIELAKTKGLGVAETTVFTYHPQFQIINKLIENYKPIERIIATFTMPPFPESNYRRQPKLGGGAISDLGPYPSAIGRIIFKDQPRIIHCRLLKRDPSTNVDLAFSMLADFGKSRSLIGTFGFDTEYINSLSLFGPNCSININNAFSIQPHQENGINFRHQNKNETIISKAGDSFAKMLEDIIMNFTSKRFDKFFHWILEDVKIRDKIMLSTKSAKESFHNTKIFKQ